MSDVGIATPCPSCGRQSLFVGSGGHLTCSRMSCQEPSVEAAIAKINDEYHEFRTLLRKVLAIWDRAPDRECAAAVHQSIDDVIGRHAAKEANDA